jgi:hypothetical protein
MEGDMTKLLIAAALTGITGAAVAQAPATAPAPPHQMMMQQTQTRDQVVARVRDHFARIDANRDGVVAREEMQAMRSAHRQHMAGRADGRRMAIRDPNAAFDRIDANRDGSISRDEFAKAREMRIEKRVVMNDGQRGGRKMGMRHGGSGGMGMGGMGLRRADANNDGRVTLAEAEAAALQRFDRMDANRDGRLTPEERRQMRMQIRTERKSG